MDLNRVRLLRPVVDKNLIELWSPVLNTPVLNSIRPPRARRLLSVLVLTVPPLEAVVLDPDRVQVVFPEPRTPSTLTIKAALAVAQASARPISATKRLAWRSGEVAKWRSGEVVSLFWSL